MLLLLGQMREQAGGAREDRDGLDRRGGKSRSSSTAAIGIETFIVSGLPQTSATASRKRARERDVRPADAALVGEREDALGARVERLVDRVAEARQPCRPASRIARAISRHGAGSPPAADVASRLLEQPRAVLGRAEDDRAAAEDARRDGALQRGGVGGERHPRGDVRSASARARRSRRAAGRGRSAAPRSARRR